MSAKLQVDIVTDARGVGPGLSSADSQLSRFGKRAGQIGRMAALGLAGVGAAAVGVGVKLFQMGDASDDANATVERITKSMGYFGRESDKATSRILKYAEATARQTGVDTNSIKATQAKLLTFKEIGKTADTAGGAFDRATRAAIDLAAAGFGSAESNAAQLGKALNDPIAGLAALTRSGVTFTEQEKARIATLVESNRIGEAQAQVLAAIEKQVGGVAAAQAGGLDRLRTIGTQAAEALGRKLVPQVDKLATWLVDKGLPAAQRLGTELSARFGPTVNRVGGFITNTLVPAAQRFYSWFVDKIAPGIARSVQPRIDALKDAFESVRSAVQRNEPQLRQIGDALAKVAEFIANRVMPVIGTLIGEGFRVLGRVIGAVVDTIGALTTGIGWAIDKIQQLVDWIGRIEIPDIPGLDKLAGLVGGSAGGLVTIGHQLLGGSPSYDQRTGWTSAAMSGSAWTSWVRTAATTGAAQVPAVDARTFLTVKVDGSGIVDEHRVADQLAGVLSRYYTRMGRPTAWPATA